MNKKSFLWCKIPPLILSFAFILLAIRVTYSEGFVVAATRKRNSVDIKLTTNGNNDSDNADDENIRRLDHHSTIIDNIVDRRQAIRNGLVLSTAAVSATTSLPDRTDATTIKGEGHQVELNCLQNLPPVSSNSIRLYLCRHGQTENNRLRKVQGSRVDPPINENGKSQAMNLGRALSFADPKPELFFSSALIRAKMTAEIAAANTKNNNDDDIVQTPPIIQQPPRQLASLAEIDFGSFADGQSISAVQGKMTQTYARWGIGDVNYQGGGDGDSGSDVLIRACEALRLLVHEATISEVNCVAAVSHSAFIHILVAMILDEPLVQSYNRKIMNGSVTVIDIPKDLLNNSQVIGMKPKLLGGPISQKPKDFTISIPTCKLIRVNEFRHLPPIIA
jgi:broad specificity phosphatase PhoE